MNCLVVNCSAHHYNLGARKVVDWLRSEGHGATYWNGDPGMFSEGYDRAFLSVVFSWDALVARNIAWRLRDNTDIECGGPGMFALGRWWLKETGLSCTKGLDPRFELQRGDYKMTFASRGCPVGCYFCIVPKLEGLDFTLDWDFKPASILCDNNLSALPTDFQEHIIRRYRESAVVLKDANSGFEPKAFNEQTYRRWKPILKGPWRFALDEMGERDEVRAMMTVLKDDPASKKRVYVLIGNEPIQSCYERALNVIEWGGEPFCQYIRPLNWLGGEQRHRFDWSDQLGRDFSRYFNRHIYRYASLAEYSNRKGESPPFQAILRKQVA